MTFTQDMKQAFWKVSSWTVSYSGKNASTGNDFGSNGDEEFSAGFIQAPLTFSYACGSPDVKVLNATHTATGTNVYIKLIGFQVSLHSYMI